MESGEFRADLDEVGAAEPFPLCPCDGSDPRSGLEIHEFAPLFTRIAQTAVIPAEVTSHGIFVSVLINGQGPFRMLVDTGCTCSMISPEVAAAVEARGAETGDDEGETTNGFGKAISVPRVLLDSLAVGGVQFEGVIAGVVPLEMQSKIDRPRTRWSDRLYPIFGYFFRPRLSAAQSDLEQRVAQRPSGGSNGAANQGAFRSAIRDVRIQGYDFDMMVDSGATDRLHLPPDMAAPLKWKVEPRPGMLLAVAGEIARERVGRLTGDARLGLLRENEPVIDISEGPPTVGVGLLR